MTSNFLVTNLVVPSTQSVASEKPAVTQNLRRKLSEMTPGVTMQTRTNKQSLWDKRGIVVSQNNRLRLNDILN